MILIRGIVAVSLFAVSLGILGKDAGPSNESLRWILPADGWRESEGYLAKGHYFRISSDVGGRRYRGGVEGIKIYENPELKESPYIITYSWLMDKDSKILCDNKSRYTPNYKTSQIFVCDNFCRKISESWRKNLISNVNEGGVATPTYHSELNRTSFGNCKIRIDGYSKIYSTDNGPENDDISYSLTHFFRDLDWGTNFYLKTDDTDFKKGYITLKDKDKKYYLDVRFCLKDPQFCRFVNIEKSEYERDLERLEKIKKEKSFARLNTLIKELRPCVLKKDKECIKKFFPKPVSKQQALINGEYPYEELVIDDEFLKELEACLDYKSLLPHLLAFRGINKACIFNSFEIGENYLLKIDYPEAVRFSSDSPVYLIK
ncbi:MAG: hypothetical protein WDA09_03365 [Bacteriovoracaceae bacterium]